MLPFPSSPDFPAALKARRQLCGMSRAALARAAGIHMVMPRRYEEPECGEFARPRADSTWLALNKALGYELPGDIDELLALEVQAQDADGAKPSAPTPLTLAQAKAGLALTFGVDPSAIDITIRG